ncbi:hypothetical protein V502_10410 [Pseudogymnoascus sp. VKM F-4520 (FW-2644)]|nr:hypothetical protein V502_10410 [Pseudogymnoascus sp. VKM F-4520 (FW-2644)]
MQLLNLPDELLLAIVSQIQSQSDLEVLVRTSRHLHDILTPELYHRDAHTKKSLGWAAKTGRPETLQKAESFGIYTHSDAGPLLFIAAENGQTSVLEYLLPTEHDWVLNWESRPESHHDDATTPLAAASQNGHYSAVKVLLDHGADHTITSIRKCGPLHLAAAFGCPIIVELLLDGGANISAIEERGLTPLHFACENGNLAVAKLLIDRGADIFVGCRVRQPLLCRAVDSGNLELVEFLLKKGCSPMDRTSRGQTPLHRAAKCNLHEISKLLISHESQVCARTDREETVLDYAAFGGDTRMITIILEAGAEIATTNVDGVSALHLAAAHATPEVLEMLINVGYDVNLKTLNDGHTPLYKTFRKRRVDNMQVLIGEGADVNADQSNGSTLLHAAAGSWLAAADAVRLLVENGADTAARDRYDRTPLDLAMYLKHDGVVELLSENGPIDLYLNSKEEVA